MSFDVPPQGCSSFWQALDTLVKSHQVIIDRPCGIAHPRYPNNTYPLDYGYLQGTSASDGNGIDVWVGTLELGQVSGVIVSVDLHRSDSEIKILLGCTPVEMEIVLEKHNLGLQSAILIERCDESALT